MSLVLEALKKLDREKGRDERGFVVMAAAPWPTRATRRWPMWAALAVAAVAAIVATIAVWAQRTTPAAVATPSTAAAPVAVNPAPAATSERMAPPPTPAAAGQGFRPAPRAAAPAVRQAPTAPAAAGDRAAPAISPAATAEGLRLQAVSERDGQPIAIVNDHLVRVGDEVDGMRVLAIRATEVDVEIKGRRLTLKF